MADFKSLTDTPATIENGKVLVGENDALVFKALEDLAGTVDLRGEGRYDIDDIADDDLRAITDLKTRTAIYRLTEKLKLILSDHDNVLYGSDLTFGIVGPKGEAGSDGSAGTPGTRLPYSRPAWPAVRCPRVACSVRPGTCRRR